jgi:hypothetical protein
MSDAAVAPARSCGTCTLCCKVLRIPELDKAHGVWCRHARPGHGCAIYADRPQSCRNFVCGYLASPELSEEWHPVRAKLVMVREPNGGITAVADPGRPDAWRAEPYYSQLKSWARQGIDARRQVIVRIGSRTIAILPDKDVDLGHMDFGEQVVIEAEEGPFGVVYNARKASQSIVAPIRSGAP